MSADQLINVLVTVTLIEMMVAIGLSVSIADLVDVARDWRLLTRAALANYVFVPLAAIGLLLLFHAQPTVRAGFLILAVCPGAPYGPPLTAIAKGRVAVAVGLMVILAGTSAVVAPLLLGLLLPLMAGAQPLAVDAARMVITLLATQLAPLAVGLHPRRPV
jgi:BASS family bile acid:Na+ symporter